MEATIQDLGNKNPSLNGHKYFYETVVTAGNDKHNSVTKEVFLNDSDDIYVRVDKTNPGTASAAIFISGHI
jgi:hypothetical protein